MERMAFGRRDLSLFVSPECDSDSMLHHPLVPYAACPVVRHRLFACRLQLFHGIIEEKVNQDGVDFCVRVLSLDLPAHKLYAPDATSYRPSATGLPHTHKRFSYLSTE